MDLKKYLDTSIPTGEVMDPQLVKSYTYQIIQGMLFCHQVRL
jgi:cyclin-dependent kinase 1